MLEALFKVALVGSLMTLAIPGVALAHAEISPAQTTAGATGEFTLEVLQEKDAPTTEVRMEVPEDFEVTGVSDPGGWRGEVKEGAVVWSGGEPTTQGSGMNFAFEARVPEEAGEYTFAVLQSYGAGNVVEWTGGADSEKPAPRIEVVAGGRPAGEGHSDEHGSHGEEMPDTGGPSPVLLLAVCTLGLAVSATFLAVRRR